MRRARHVVTGTRSDTRVEVVAERRRAVAGRERRRLRARREPRPGGFRGVEVPRFPVHVGGGVPVRRRRRVTPVAARGGGRSLPMRDFSAPGGRARAHGAHFWTTHVRARARLPRTDLQVCSDSLFQRSREVVAVARRRGGLRPRRGARWARRQSEVVGPRLPRTGGHGARRATTGQRGPRRARSSEVRPKYIGANVVVRHAGGFGRGVASPNPNPAVDSAAPYHCLKHRGAFPDPRRGGTRVRARAVSRRP